jgi:hypothetical protein
MGLVVMGVNGQLHWEQELSKRRALEMPWKVLVHQMPAAQVLGKELWYARSCIILWGFDIFMLLFLFTNEKELQLLLGWKVSQC